MHARPIHQLLLALSLSLGFATVGCDADESPDSALADQLEPTTAPLTIDGATTPDAAAHESARERASLADAVFVGEVVAIDFQLSEPDAQGEQMPFTLVTFAVTDGIKGVDTGAQHALRFIGGPFDGDKFLEVSEVPRFELGDRDLLFVAGNGVSGCPLVGGAEGRVQLLAAGARGDGVSTAASPAWAAAIAADLRAAGLAQGPAVESLVRDEPFEFAMPPAATREQLAAHHARHLTRKAAAEQAAATRKAAPVDPEEARALAANGFNPVIPR